jgi:hypothetical protein
MFDPLLMVSSATQLFSRTIELISGDYPSFVTTLRINDWLTQLNIENQKFKDLMTDRYEEASKRPTFRMKTARKETDKALHSIFEQVEALATVNGAGKGSEKGEG